MAFLKFGLIGLVAVLGSALGAPQANLANDPDFIRAQRLGEEFDQHPVYAYSFQVADDDEQTYIAKQESRDGDETTGEYSYVDATGSLVTVTYRAGPMGYTEERSVQPNFVTIRSRPTVSRTVTTNTNVGNRGIVTSGVTSSGFGSRRTQVTNANVGSTSGGFGARRTQTTTTTSSNSGATGNAALVGSVVRRIAPAVQRVVTTETSSSSAGANSGDLVARILAQLTPFIRQTVSNSIAGQQGQTTTTTTTRRIDAVEEEPIAPVIRSRVVTTNVVPSSAQTSSSSARTTANIFGSGGASSIRFENPNTNFAVDI